MPDIPQEVIDKITETLREEFGRQSTLPGVRIAVLICATLGAIWFLGGLGDFFAAYANAINVKYGGP